MASFSSHREKPNLATESIGLGFKLPTTLGPAPRLPSFHVILSGPTSHYRFSSFGLPSFFCTTAIHLSAFHALLAEGWNAGGLEGWRVGGQEGWRAGGLAGWRVGGLEGWRVGGLEGWTTGGLEVWRAGGLEPILQPSISPAF